VRPQAAAQAASDECPRSRAVDLLAREAGLAREQQEDQQRAVVPVVGRGRDGHGKLQFVQTARASS